MFDMTGGKYKVRDADGVELSSHLQIKEAFQSAFAHAEEGYTGLSITMTEIDLDIDVPTEQTESEPGNEPEPEPTPEPTPEPDPDAVLPQDHSYQVAVREWIGTLTEEDLALTLQRWSWPDDASDPENALRWHWTHRDRYQNRTTRILRADASQFLLSSIEANGDINVKHGRGDAGSGHIPISAMWCLAPDDPGNPYALNEALGRRLLVFGVVDMMMVEQAHESGQNTRSDYAGKSLATHALAYLAAKRSRAVPEDVLLAYEEGMRRAFGRIEEWGPTGIFGDMDMQACIALQLVSDAVEDIDLQDRSFAYYRDQYAPQHVYDAGFFDHAGGFDQHYQGIDLFFANWLVSMTEDQERWHILRDHLGDAYWLKNHLYLPDGERPEDVHHNTKMHRAPSHANSHMAPGTPRDQWHVSYRDAFAHRNYDHAVYLKEHKYHSHQGLPDDPLQAVDGRYEQDINSDSKLDQPWDGSFGTWRYDTGNLYMPFTAVWWKNGSYQRHQDMEEKGSPLLLGVHDQEDDFIRRFGDEFLIWKKGGRGGVIHVGRLSWSTSYGIPGFGGGSLSGYYKTDNGGVIGVLGRSRGPQSPPESDEWSNWPTWNGHLISGKTEDGIAFSSGGYGVDGRDPIPGEQGSWSASDASVSLSIQGTIGASTHRTVQEDLGYEIGYSRTFEIRNDGSLRVQSGVSLPDHHNVSELWEMIPLFLTAGMRPEGTIEMRIDGNWGSLTSAQSGVDAVRLMRRGSTFLVAFVKPRTVTPKPEWSISSQLEGEIHGGVMIDLLENPSVEWVLS